MDQVWLWWKLDWGSHNLFNLMLIESSSPENISGASQRKKHSAEHRSKFKNIENNIQFTDNDFSAPTSDTMCKHFLHIIQLRVLIMSISRELDYTGQALWGHFSHSCFTTLKQIPISFSCLHNAATLFCSEALENVSWTKEPHAGMWVSKKLVKGYVLVAALVTSNRSTLSP